MQCIRAIGHADAVRRLIERGKLLFKLAYILAEDEVATPDGAQDRGIHLGLEIVVLAEEVNELDFCAHFVFSGLFCCVHLPGSSRSSRQSA